ncbi:HAD-IA family hydrolase [Kitasatospora sp. NBC_01287]|uniref:HAD family hydrolase n=1 Tax=Kitasatospora sp. NBC_01287 TaxID=2903573 RepID=UPI00225482CB|nr:HAD-IA family hydrolase [Kitasatospora sp. NBC_01287]MCX4745382.1 HAD-IA family hydrolase [Kitasatospora sp. NBC_01287]
MIKGIMFDFSSTLFRIETAEQWWGAVAAAAGLTLTAEELAEGARRLTAHGALPGGPAPDAIPQELAEAWEKRDLSPAQHRAAYAGLVRAAGAPMADLADALYDRHMTPRAWRPYPDAEPTLHELRRRGVPVVVVSNIGWDLRPVFREHRLDGLVDDYVLSFEFGAQKPDRAIFQAACDRLGLAPGEVLMVGDDRRADGGAAALGCPLHLVDALPVDQRPAALGPLLDLLGG